LECSYSKRFWGRLGPAYGEARTTALESNSYGIDKEMDFYNPRSIARIVNGNLVATNGITGKLTKYTFWFNPFNYYRGLNL